jgi:tRNA-dihydrouridine synthase A
MATCRGICASTPKNIPVALQLGGSEPADLAHCAKLGEEYGYDEINLNCGCPSERVQRGAFGACLMAEPDLVADGVKAMVDAVSIPVTVKHRIGIDKTESYEFVRDFVGKVSEAGCTTFIVHARNAWLKGLSPKENREIPPLRYEQVYRLKRDFPHLAIGINGGITTEPQIATHLEQVDSVMVGREAYHNPWLLAGFDAAFFGAAPACHRVKTWSWRWSTTWSAWRANTARRGTRSPGTCWACAMACRARGAGARCGAITG